MASVLRRSHLNRALCFWSTLMNNEYIAPFFTVLGVIVGGGVSYFTAMRIKLLEFKQSNIKLELERRKKLYGDFLAETNRLALDSIVKKNSDPIFLAKISSLLVEIELVSNSDVHEKAKEIVGHILDINSQIPKDRNDLPPLRAQFVELVKTELQQIQQQT